nr:MFS transporter [Granulosicoccus antarcticus]
MPFSDSSTQNHGRWAIALICIAHFFSHFYMLLLPPLLPVISEAMQISYTQLGFGITMFSLMTGLAQAPMGVFVDRIGAGWVLIIGLALEGLAFSLIGVWPVYGAFVFLMGVAGLGNAVYHPADYAILNAVALPERMGRAFSYHTAAGHFGEAMAPLTVLLLASLYGWQHALMICGLLGVVIAGVLYSRRAWFNTGTESSESAANSASSKAEAVHEATALKVDAAPAPTQPINSKSEAALARRHLLLSRPILMSVAFFIGLTLVGRGVTGFGVTALHEQHGFSLTLAGTLISAWLFASPLGVLAGGRIADGKRDFQKTIVACLLFIAAGISLLAWMTPGIWLSGTLFALCGFASGAIAPSRDMLVRSLTPPGQAGTVFGFVSTGFNLGGIIAPPIFGFLLDRGAANGVFWIVALASLLTVLTVIGSSGKPANKVAHTMA